MDRTARALIALLEKVSNCPQQWQQSSVLKQMIQRYYRFMQLKASHSSNLLLIPTLDIEIVWQTHLLRPEIYQNDCLRLFHRVIDHSLIINDIEQLLKVQAFIDTCQLYEQKFGETYCPLPPIDEMKSNTASNFLYDPYEEVDRIEPIYCYWDKTDFEFSSTASQEYENPFSFTEGDIILDGKWFDMCKQFMSNTIKKVSIQNRYCDGSTQIELGLGALRRLKKSYERFLYMAAKYPLKDGNGFIPPTYAVNISFRINSLSNVEFRSISCGILICKNH